MAVDKAIATLGVELSRLLRYSYGGFLFIAFAAFLNPMGLKAALALSWQLAALTALVVGAGLYAAHRGFVIYVHHYFGCFLFWLLWDKAGSIPASETCSPTRWLNHLGVPRCHRMAAYSALRRSDFLSEKEQEKLNLAHAESGLVVMTAAGFGAAAWFVAKAPDWVPAARASDFWLFLGLAFVFLLASYPGALRQHASECLAWRRRESAAQTVLERLGFLEPDQLRLPFR